MEKNKQPKCDNDNNINFYNNNNDKYDIIINNEDKSILDCKNCRFNYKCCHDYHVTLNPNEANYYKNKRLRQVFENNKVIGLVWTLTTDDNGYCSYFDTTNKTCKIHQFKPEVCRNYTCQI